MADEDDDDLDGAIAEDEIDGAPDESEEDEDEPAPKAKPAVEEEDEEEAPAPKKKAVGVKSKGKGDKTVATGKNSKHRGTAKATKTAEKATKHKAVRASRTGDRPFLDTSGIGRAFKLAEKGISIRKLKQFIADNDLQPWVLSFIRKGETLNGKYAWKVEEEDGKILVSGVRKVSAKKAA